MGLREQAESDLSFILEDADYGFGWPITITDPDGNSASLTGSSNDISQAVDPDTGAVVSGRLATVTIRISSLTAAGLGMPISIASLYSLPWVVVFDDINGNSFKFKVAESNPDRTLGIVSCMLEEYEND